MNAIILSLIMFSFTELFSDMNLVLKLLLFLTIVSFVRQHLGNSALSWVIIAAIAYFILFMSWGLFGSIYVIYLLLMLGVSGIIVDFFFVMPSKGGVGEAAPDVSSKDIATRRTKISQAGAFALQKIRGIQKRR